MNRLAIIMFAWLMNLMSKIFGNTAEMNMNQDQSGQAVAKGNWMGPDGTESGPNVPEIGTQPMRVQRRLSRGL